MGNKVGYGFVLVGTIQGIALFAALIVGSGWLTHSPEDQLFLVLWPINLLLLAASGIVFLIGMWTGAEKMSAVGRIVLPSFGSTLFWSFVPFANLYVPWRNIATVRNTMERRIASGKWEIAKRGRGRTVFLAVLFFVGSQAVGFVAGVFDPLTAIPPELSFNIALLFCFIWLTAFLYAANYLLTFEAMVRSVQDGVVAGPLVPDETERRAGDGMVPGTKRLENSRGAQRPLLLWGLLGAVIAPLVGYILYLLSDPGPVYSSASIDFGSREPIPGTTRAHQGLHDWLFYSSGDDVALWLCIGAVIGVLIALLTRRKGS